MKNLIKLLLEAFDVRCFEGAAVGGVVTEDEDHVEEIDLGPIDDYIGNKEVNPNRTPLKDFDREGMTHDDIDSLIDGSEGKLYLSPEEIKKLAEAAEKEGGEGGKGKKEKTDEDPDNKDKIDKKDDEKQDDDKGDKKGKDEPDPETVEFFKQTDMTQEEFSSLSEKAQKKLVSEVYGKSENAKESVSLKEKVEKLESWISTVSKDASVAARLEEINSGKSILADPEKIVTDEMMVKIDAVLAAEGDDNTAKAKKMILDIVKDAVKAERSVADNNARQEQHEKDTWKVLRSLGKLNPELKIDERDHKKIKSGHPEWQKYTENLGGVVDWANKKGILNNLKNMSKEEVYAAYSTHKGWDKDRDTKIFDSGADGLLKKLKNPKYAKSLDQGKKQVKLGSRKAETNIDYDTLKDEMLKGDMKQYTRLVKATEHSPEVTTLLSDLHFAVDQEREAQRT